jgi:hypothetical protein
MEDLTHNKEGRVGTGTAGRRSLASIVLMNVMLFLSLLALVIVLPPAIADAWRGVRSALGIGTGENWTDVRATLPNYKGEDWAKLHFREFLHLQGQYYDFLTYRRKGFAGKTITINDQGFRVWPNAKAKDTAGAQAWFFGASTMWGTGARDAETIPAYFEATTGVPSFNFGESGFIAHQSLNQLMRGYDAGGRPRLVFFYDGVADIEHKCRVGQSVFSTSQEETIRQLTGNNLKSILDTGDSKPLLLQVFQPTVSAITGRDQPTQYGESDTGYDCHASPGKAAIVARMLVNDWATAKWLVESHGGAFVPVLQPVSFLGKPNLSYLPQEFRAGALGLQFKAVYDEIRRQLAERGLRYLDLTQVYNGDEQFYVDFAHVSPNGYERVAKALAQALKIAPAAN